KNMGQIPIYYNHLPTGRPLPEGKWFTKFRSNYLDVDNDPLYPFGYGMSYSTFAYGQPALSSTVMDLANGSLTITVPVTNTGSYDADEIVQLYVRDLVGSVSRPVKELKGFSRISLKKGETRNVTFTLKPDDLKFYNQQLEYKCEPGDYEVMVGPNSRDLQTLKFTLQ
ncbi:MAG: fibronectin type III-like domain-contianing protein, partial [Massilibacteroides sp.]|nr:fibronectin type III-like domain-contianing protein [Massilibacteroides sp.]